jgi:anti-anti-sigma factor
MRLLFWLCVPFLRLAGFDCRDRRPPPPRGYARTPGPRRARALADKRPEPTPRLEVEVIEAGQEVAVWLRGEAGVAEAGVLEKALSRLVTRRPARVIFDLSGLRLLSSLALGVLADYRRAAVRAGVRVGRASTLQPAVCEALERAELMHLFEVVGDAEPSAGPGPSENDVQDQYPKVADVERTHGIAWSKLVELEPQLETLLWRARQVGAGCRTFADVERAFASLRNELTGLVGFLGKHHRHLVLGSAGAYEVAYWKLYDAVAGLLPDHVAPEGHEGAVRS